MISLIATRHTERGNCTSNELHKIIEKMAPDVIFTESSPEGLAATQSGLYPPSLEIHAVNLYLQNHPIIHLPVDIDGNKLIDKTLKDEILKMLDRFEIFLDYQELLIQHDDLSTKYGFPYLNSDQCTELLKRKFLLEKALLKVMNDEKTTQIYRRWIYIHEIRETEMLKNIYSYTNANKYNRAIFLVGAEHRWPIIEKVPKIEEREKLKLNWDFNYFK